MIESYGWVTPDSEAKQATIGLTKTWDDTLITDEVLDYVAHHEVLHLLLADLVHVGNQRQSTQADFTTAQHAIIRRLENAI